MENLGQLVARGRVHGQKERQDGLGMVQTVKPFGKINGARLETFHPHNKTITIHVDDSTVPEFWLEIDLPLAQLVAFVEEMQKLEREEEESTEIKNEEEEKMDL
jgi:hypothetical protein